MLQIYEVFARKEHSDSRGYPDYGFDDSMASKESNPSLTTIHQEANLRAKTAIECLEAMRDGTEYKPQIVLPVDLIKRESTRKL